MFRSNRQYNILSRLAEKLNENVDKKIIIHFLLEILRECF